MSHPTALIAPTTTLVIFDSQVTDLPLLYKALLPGSIDHTIQPHQDPIDHITHLLTQTGATKLAIVAHGQLGSIQIGNGQIDRAMLEDRSGLLQEWELDSIALYSCEVGMDAEFIQRFAELTGAEIAASTSKIGAGNWELDGGMELLEIDRLADYNGTLATFNGTAGADYANASLFSGLTGFTDGTLAELTDGSGDTFNGGDGSDYVFAGIGDDFLNGDAGDDYLNGSDGNDVIEAGSGSNTLSGGAGNDRIRADYSDTVDGGSGNDALLITPFPYTTNAYTVEFTSANAGNFKLNGTQTGTFAGIEQLAFGGSFSGNGGNDKINASLANLSVTPLGLYSYGLNIYGNGGSDTVLGSAGIDAIYGEDDNDFLYGQGGDDTLRGGAGFDIIFGGAGVDTISGDASNDTIFGGTENDFIRGDDGEDYLYGEDGDDTIRGGYGFDVIYGQAGDDLLYGEGVTLDGFFDITTPPFFGLGINDTIFGGSGSDRIQGGIGDDVLLGEDGFDVISGGSGSDFIYGGSSVDLLDGDDGNDYIVGQGGNDDLSGNDGIDYLEGGDGDDTLYGGNNEDYLYGNVGVDNFYGGAGNDFLDGGDGNDQLRGEEGNDVMFGVEGDDYLNGGIGDDYLYGGNGNDTLYGDNGGDFLIGGAGSDTFQYLSMNDAGDIITDFNPALGVDKLDLSFLFSSIGVVSGAVNGTYLQFIQSGTSPNTIVQIDQDGLGGIFSFVTIATLNNVNAPQITQGINVLI